MSCLFVDELVLPKIVADSQLPLTDVTASVSESPSSPSSPTKTSSNLPILPSTPVSPMLSDKPFVLPLKHPLPPSLTSRSPLPGIDFDPSNVVVDPPLPSSYEVRYAASSPSKVPKEVRYFSLSPRVLVKGSPAPDSPFQSSGGGVCMSTLSNYDDEMDALSRAGREFISKDPPIRKFFLLHPDQNHLISSEAISKVPDLDSRKVYYCPVLNHIVTCEEGEFENEAGVPAPEFDCIVDLESGNVGDVFLMHDHANDRSQLLHAEASLVSVPIQVLPDSSSLRRSSRTTASRTSPSLQTEADSTSGLSRCPVGSY